MEEDVNQDVNYMAERRDLLYQPSFEVGYSSANMPVDVRISQSRQQMIPPGCSLRKGDTESLQK